MNVNQIPFCAHSQILWHIPLFIYIPSIFDSVHTLMSTRPPKAVGFWSWIFFSSGCYSCLLKFVSLPIDNTNSIAFVKVDPSSTRAYPHTIEWLPSVESKSEWKCGKCACACCWVRETHILGLFSASSYTKWILMREMTKCETQIQFDELSGFFHGWWLICMCVCVCTSKAGIVVQQDFPTDHPMCVVVFDVCACLCVR